MTSPSSSLPVKQKLPNASTVLILGIISIAVCAFGVVTGTIALVLASKDLKLYNANPSLYEEGSLSNISAGRTCAIIGICLSVLAIVFWILYILMFISFFNFFGDAMENAIEYNKLHPIE